jgi:hypothetical protein
VTLTRRSPMRTCGKPYDSRADAVIAASAGTAGDGQLRIVPPQCGCGGYHVRKLAAPAARPRGVAFLRPVRSQGKSAARKGSRRGAGEFTAKVKLQCRTRAGGGEAGNARCESCGCWLGPDGGQIQHRLARGSGGSRNPLVSSLANAALLCGTSVTPSCHGDAESRDPERRMREKGFVILHGEGPEFDPRFVAIELHSMFGGGMSVWLAEDGIGDDGNGYLFSQPPAGGEQ